jgi:hypothetical protein
LWNYFGFLKSEISQIFNINTTAILPSLFVIIVQRQVMMLYAVIMRSRFSKALKLVMNSVIRQDILNLENKLVLRKCSN